MKRNLDLIRDILLIIEEYSTPSVPLSPSSFKCLNTTPETVFFHLQLLDDAGYIDAQIIEGCMGHYACQIFRLTNDGCDYLDSVRDSKIYSSIKQKLGSLFYNVPLDVIKQVGTSIILSKLNF